MIVLPEPLGGSMSPTLIVALSVLSLLYFVFRLFRQRSKSPELPIFGDTKQNLLWDALMQGGKEARGEPFMIPGLPNAPPTIILPRKYINDVKSLPSSIASFDENVYKTHQGKYTGIGIVDPTSTHWVKADLTRNIPRVLHGLQDEADFCIPANIGDCNDWTPIKFYPALTRIVAHLSGRIFVGLPLCRNEDWIQSTISYTFDVIAAVQPISKLNPLVRPFKAWSIPEVQRILEHREKGKVMLEPMVKTRIEAMRDPTYEPNNLDLIEYMILNGTDEKKEDVWQKVIAQLNLSMAAIHTTSMNVTNVIYDLCAYPEHIQPLREELDAMMAADGGKFVKTNIAKLKKMDSFIKESQRFSPPSMTSMGREAVKPITLHDGFVVPAGQLFAFSSIGISHDPDLFPNPLNFDGFRFSDLRELPGNQNKYQLVTTGVDAISFGHGVHACPGRFFASSEIKVILAGILLRYDIGLKKGGERAERPANIHIGVNVMPDTQKDVWFKKRSLI